MNEPSVEGHYGATDLEESILDALHRSGKDIESLSPDDLAPVDEFHIRGREATEDLAALVEIDSEWHVLDVGCGLGGSARYLAHAHGVHVTGLDLTAEYCRVATRLSDRVGLADLTSFQQGSALDMPFEEASFDLVWTEHAQMNIDDKAKLYGEIARVLKPGGRFVFHDIFQGEGGQPHFPVPWAGDSTISSLITVDTLGSLLESVGLVPLHWQDRSEVSLNWFRHAVNKLKTQGPSPLGLHLLMGADAKTKFANVARNLEEERIVVFQSVLQRRGNDDLSSRG